MKRKNIKEKVFRYLIAKNFRPRSIKYLGGGNHFNYKFKSGGKELVLRMSNPGAVGVGKMFDVESEFKILMLVEKHHISPKPIALDKTGLGAPLLLESHVRGAPYAKFRKLDNSKLKAALALIAKISRIKINPRLLKFKYRNYSVNIKNWNRRIKEIEKIGKKYKETEKLASVLRVLSRRAAEILRANEGVLLKTRPEFIYNDIHGENLFWVKKEKKAIFIDWQKVSWGDPSFMLAVFALALESKAVESREKFYEKILKEYKKMRNIKNLETLFYLRILEREIANAIWVPWHALKSIGRLPFKKANDYSRLSRAESSVYSALSMFSNSRE